MCQSQALVTVTVLLAAAGAVRAQDVPAPAGEEVPRDAVTASLNEVWGLTPEEAARRVESLRRPGGPAAELLAAVALERAGRAPEARAAYEALAAADPDSPYAHTAGFRLRLLDRPEVEWDGICRGAADEDGAAAAAGWYLLRDGWAWGDQRQAALQLIMQRRASWPMVRFFQWIRERSFFPARYSYLFVLLVLTAGFSLLMLPFYFELAKFRVGVRRLAPQIRKIQELYQGNPVQHQRELVELYRAHGLSPLVGCAPRLLELVFIIAGLVTLRNFAPQMQLDGGSFLWVDDVTRFDLVIAAIWVGVNLVTVPFSAAPPPGQTRAGLGCGALVFGLAVLAAARYWQWPAYVFIFWQLLSIFAAFLASVFWPIASLTRVGHAPSPAPGVGG
jgi:hypothetical protein